MSRAQRKVVDTSTTASQATPNSSAASNRKSQETSHPFSGSSTSPNEPDLLYLHILNDVEETPHPRPTPISPVSTPLQTSARGLTPRNCLSTNLCHLDECDKEYLARKGIFNLPPTHSSDALVKTYFNYVYPVSPVISRADFVQGYQSGTCSLLLLFAVFTTASVHAQSEVLSACGFSTRSAAQKTFFSKARLLYDFGAEDDPVVVLQACINLCMVVLDHSSDRDFGYWFHNAVNRATKLNLRDKLDDEGAEDNVTRDHCKLHRRIWRSLCSLDVFHASISFRRTRLLEDCPAIMARISDEGNDEDTSAAACGLLPTLTPQQKISPVVFYELSRIIGECFSIGKTQTPHHDMFHSLDSWRTSLPARMHTTGTVETDICYLTAQALSYRYECILCRSLLRASCRPTSIESIDWAKERLRSAMLELDTIAKRVLANGTLEHFPTPFMTTIIALLALHIESALDPTETDLIRSMSRISICQTMLVLNQGRDIPALKRAVPIFEELLERKNLHMLPPANSALPATHTVSQDPQCLGTGDALAVPHAQADNDLPSSHYWEQDSLLDMDFLGFDFLDEWQLDGQQDLPG